MTQEQMLYSDLMRKHTALQRDYNDLKHHYNKICDDRCDKCGKKILWGEKMVSSRAGSYHKRCWGGA